eukprot:gene22683-biopygen5771
MPWPGSGCTNALAWVRVNQCPGLGPGALMPWPGCTKTSGLDAFAAIINWSHFSWCGFLWTLPPPPHRIWGGGAGMVRAWRGLFIGFNGVERRGRGAGMAWARPVSPGRLFMRSRAKVRLVTTMRHKRDSIYNSHFRSATQKAIDEVLHLRESWRALCVRGFPRVGWGASLKEVPPASSSMGVRGEGEKLLENWLWAGAFCRGGR